MMPTGPRIFGDLRIDHHVVIGLEDCVPNVTGGTLIAHSLIRWYDVEGMMKPRLRCGLSTHENSASPTRALDTARSSPGMRIGRHGRVSYGRRSRHPGRPQSPCFRVALVSRHRTKMRLRTTIKNKWGVVRWHYRPTQPARGFPAPTVHPGSSAPARTTTNSTSRTASSSSASRCRASSPRRST